MSVGSSLSVAVGGAVAHSAVFSSMIHGTIGAETAKAVKLVFDSGQFVWIPKSALVVPKTPVYSGDWYKLARWFDFSAEQWRIIERNQHIGGQSAA